jgi:diacylglycerol O-acyltransferase
VMPLAVPLTGDRAERLAAVVRQRARLGVGSPRGSSGAATSMGFRTLAALGLFQPFVNRQRLVHTFVSNLRGPDEPVVLAGGRVTRVAPIAITPGNVTASFDVLSLAGRLVVTVVTDPVRVPDHALLRDALAAELAGLGA